MGEREDVGRVALGIDVRERRFLHEVPRVFDELRARAACSWRSSISEASDDALVRRFSETRRPHPAADCGSLADGIRREREALRTLRGMADRIIDTSAFTVHELRAALRARLESPESGAMTISLVSFGYKYGLPTDADLALDCRFLPNPFFVEDLRPGSLDSAVASTCSVGPARRSSSSTCSRCSALPRYQPGKGYLTIAISCTGGRHRSVVLVRRCASGSLRWDIASVRHRDLER